MKNTYANEGHVQVAKYLIEAGIDVNERDENDQTLLHWVASRKKFKDLVQVLVDKDADANALDDENETPIFKAVRNGKHDAVEKLIDAGADLNFKNEENQTVLDLAKAKQNSNLIQLLSAKLENE